ncbi:MAG: mandelate racemase/muconate lactonizing enzyme family protein [Bdellovibrionales bacterium]
MKLTNIELRKLEIPFRVSFRHASAERSVTETVIAIAHSETGLKGYGEGCPRQYVTGENIESCTNFLDLYRHVIQEIRGTTDLKAFVDNNTHVIDKHPSAWCAIEIALLDLIGKEENTSIEAVLGLPEINEKFEYTAVLGISKPKIFQSQLEMYLKFGFRDFKIKISGDAVNDATNIKGVLGTEPNAKIRLDANNLWKGCDEAHEYLSALQPYFWSIEEPLKAGDYSGLQKLALQQNCKIVLDESLLTLQQLDELQENPEIWVPNIRISKMGGLLRSLAIASECAKRGMSFIVGAQVGETSLLTRTALPLANRYIANVIAQEGAFGTYLLERDITDKPIMFSTYGRLTLIPESKDGLGVHVDDLTF